jgi:hypothetical protein
VISFSLEEESWTEELAFSKKRDSFLNLNAWYPVLVNRSSTYTIDQLVLAFTEDLTTTDPTQIAVEEVQVNDDGSLTPL